MTITVLIVDEHPIVRLGLRAYLSIDPAVEVVGEASDGQQALGLAERLRPDVMVLDVLSPALDSIGLISAVRQRSPETRILVLATPDYHQVIIDALAAGASAVLPKNAELHELGRAIGNLRSGQKYISQKLANRIIDQAIGAASREELTKREKQVWVLLKRGSSNKEIAAALDISLPTVKTHVRSILGKLRVSSRTQAALHFDRRAGS